MRIIKHTIKTKATPSQVWKVWEDVDGWKHWDPEIELSQIDGPFQSGTTGTTKFVGTPVFKTRLTAVEVEKLVVQEAYLSGARVVSYQSMRHINGETEVTFEVKIQGPLSLFFSLALGRFIKKKIPPEMEEMNRRALAVVS
ncbi:MAG: SRPBCC family protein [Chlamydiia bacterium]|nr:SRPBCC family protein [Chlamydiia bacterium]